MSCPICLENFNTIQEKTITKCAHHFHKDCLEEWLHRNGSCPLCRTNLCEVVVSREEFHNMYNNMFNDIQPNTNVIDTGVIEDIENQIPPPLARASDGSLWSSPIRQILSDNSYMPQPLSNSGISMEVELNDGQTLELNPRNNFTAYTYITVDRRVSASWANEPEPQPEQVSVEISLVDENRNNINFIDGSNNEEHINGVSPAEQRRLRRQEQRARNRNRYRR